MSELGVDRNFGIGLGGYHVRWQFSCFSRPILQKNIVPMVSVINDTNGSGRDFVR